jgi:hypothetical protein
MADNCEFFIRKNHWENPGIDGRIILRCVIWFRLSWLEIGTDGEQLSISHTKEPLGNSRHIWEDNINFYGLD